MTIPAFAIPHDTALYRQRHRIENMFGKLNDWRRIHTRYDRCAHTFMSAIYIAATIKAPILCVAVSCAVDGRSGPLINPERCFRESWVSSWA